MADVKWGVKRTCHNCESRFYDLQKTPPTCPKCSTVLESFTISSRNKRGNKTNVLNFKDTSFVNDSVDLSLSDDILEVDAGMDDSTLLEEGIDSDYDELPEKVDRED